MSLVNDMLRDLEKRHQRPDNAASNSLKAAQLVAESRPANAPRLVLWAIGIAAIATTAWLLWQQPGPDRAPVPVTVTPQPLPIPEQEAEQAAGEIPDTINDKAAESAAPLLQAAAVIKSIQWAGSASAGDLVIRLSQPIDVQILSQTQDQITLALSEVELRTALPAPDSSLIRELEIQREPSRLLLTLGTHQPSQFAFKVQQSPAAIVLGVLAMTPASAVAMLEPDAEDKTLEVVAVQPADAAPAEITPQKQAKPLIRNAAELQVESNAGVTPVAVSKSKQSLTETQLVKRAQQAINKGQLNEAVSLLQKRIQSAPEQSRQARVLLATVWVAQGDDAAAVFIADSLQKHPQDAALKKLQARLWLGSGQSAAVIPLLQTQPPSINRDPEYFELLATAYQQQLQTDEAAKLYYQLLQSDAGVARWWIGMGYALEQSQRYADARSAYQSGLQIPSIAPNVKQYARQRLQALANR